MAPHKRTTKFAAATLGMTGMAVALLPGLGLPGGPAMAASVRPGGIGPAGTAQAGTAQSSGMTGSGAQQSPRSPWAPGSPGSPNSPEEAAKAQIAALYQQAEAATQSYDAAQEQIGRIEGVLSGETSQAQRLRTRLATLTSGLGRLAAQQYRSSGIDPTVLLMFSSHPDAYLAESELISLNAAEQQRQLHTVLTDQATLATLDSRAGRQLADLRTQEAAVTVTRTQIQAKLAAARQQLDGLTRSERVQVAAALAGGDNGDGLGSTVPAVAPTLGSLLASVTDVAAADGSGPIDISRVQKAVSAAYSELGKPYVYGAIGPDAFDCSGLTQHVWAVAGVALPRTSEEQADIGPGIPVSQIQPGDLVIYFAGRTHVGIYVGHGMVIHAPRPGSDVQFTTLNSMPINKIVRPTG
jgi:peptidoglycan DL-endopeptidase CwlO